MLKAGQSRIYVTKEIDTGKERLVDCGNPSQAIRHVARGKFVAKLADQRDLVRLRNVEVETYKPAEGADAE